MKFESVRLLHAQGVPNRYIANQVYQPIDEDHQRRGSFIILLDQGNTPDGSFVASLTNTLIREYYRQTSHDRLGCFEQTLVRLNEQIKLYIKNTETMGSIDLNGAIVLITHDEIHITYIGAPLAYLYRDNDLISLIDTESDPSNYFSVITSGEIQLHDVLVLSSPSSTKTLTDEDFRFALAQDPLYEVGRGLARILKQKAERSFEATFIHFNEESSTPYQIYVDKTLETTGEKLAKIERTAAKHMHFVFGGVQSITKRAQDMTKKDSHEVSAVTVQAIPEYTIDEEVIGTKTFGPTPVVDETIDVDIMAETQGLDEKIPNATPEQLEAQEEQFAVAHYWKGKEESNAAATNTALEAVISAHEPAKFVDSFPLKSKHVKARTLYMLLGALVLMVVIIKIVNAIPNQNEPSTTTAERDQIITEAETAARNAEAAQVQDDITTAISQLLTSQELLAKLPEKSQTEKSKALSSRVADTLTTLSKTTPVQATSTQPVTAPAPVKKLITTTSHTYGLAASTVYHFPAAQPLSNLPTDIQILDGVAFDKFQKVAILAKTSNETKIFIIDPTKNEAQAVETADGKPWPTARFIASFETNLYLVGDTMTKAIPQGAKYRTLAYAKETSTKDLQGIVNNGAFFYAIEKAKNLVRVANNAPKNAIKPFGVPEKFLPNKIDRLISSRKEGFLYFFDAFGQRLIYISTDGGYRQQFSLPADSKYTDCDVTDSGFTCVNEKNEIQSFTIPTS